MAPGWRRYSLFSPRGLKGTLLCDSTAQKHTLDSLEGAVWWTASKVSTTQSPCDSTRPIQQTLQGADPSLPKGPHTLQRAHT